MKSIPGQAFVGLIACGTAIYWDNPLIKGRGLMFMKGDITRLLQRDCDSMNISSDYRKACISIWLQITNKYSLKGLVSWLLAFVTEVAAKACYILKIY